MPGGDINERVLFPDRGSKVALGKVYGKLAFGSTRPRNLMPGHMTTGDDKRQHDNLARVRAAQKKLTDLRFKALSKHEKVFALEKQHLKRHNQHMSSKRLREFKLGIDHLHREEDDLRAPDQTGFLRSYSSLDKATWGQTEMRTWYTKNGPKSMPAGVATPWAFAGATTSEFASTSDDPAPPMMIPPSPSYSASPPPSRTNRSSGRAGAAARTSARSASSSRSRSVAAGAGGGKTSLRRTVSGAGAMPGVWNEYDGHWMDFQAALAQSKRQDAARPSHTIRRPWKDRPVHESAPPPPLDTLMARERALYDMRGSAADVELRNRLKDKMYRGESEGKALGWAD